jgi:hypothetical protein
MTRFCPNCGTEVDESALFCPSCGQPIEPLDDLPVARTAAAEPVAAATSLPAVTAAPAADEAPAVGAAAAPPIGAGQARTEAHPRSPAAEPEHIRQAPAAAPPRADRQVNVPVTWPATLSGWLIGIGVVIAALGVLVGFFDRFFNPIDVLLLPALLLVAATVFFSTTVPRIPYLAVGTLAVALVAFGVGLDRIGFGGAGMAELLLFLGAATAAVGGIVLEVGHDQPLGGRGT